MARWRAGRPAGDERELIVQEPIAFENLVIFPVTSKVARDQDRFITLAEGLKSGVVSVSEVGLRVAVATDDPFSELPVAGSNVGKSPFDDECDDDAVGTSAERLASAAAVQRFADDGDQPAPSEYDAADESFDVDGDVNCLWISNHSDRPLYLMPGEILVGGKQDRTVAEELVVAPHTERMPIQVYCVEQGRWSYRTGGENEQLSQALVDEQRRRTGPSSPKQRVR